MRITDIIWKNRCVEKLFAKHNVTVDEVEDVLLSRPIVRKVARGRIRGENIYAGMAQARGGRYLIVFVLHRQKTWHGAAHLGPRYERIGAKVL